MLPVPLCSSHTSCGVYTCSSLIHTADVQTVVPVDVFWFLEIINNQEIRQTHHFLQQINAYRNFILKSSLPLASLH